MPSKLPDFLIIGAMKAGTTSLFRDLDTHPDVFVPADKEPGNLGDDAVLTPAGRAAYAAHFAAARPGQRCGEASTVYTKLPDVTGVPGRARELLGAGPRVVYLVREPVSRVISHHHHEYSARLIDEPDVNRAVRTVPRLIDYTRYAMQIDPWLDTFGPDHVRIVRSESYRADRRATTAEISRFIGVDPRPELVRTEVVYNRSEGKPVPEGLFGAVRRSRLYRSLLRPWLSADAKDRLRSTLLPTAPGRPAPPSAETVDYILEQLAGDCDRLAAIMGLDEPVWDLEAVRRHYGPADGYQGPAAAPAGHDPSRTDPVRSKNLQS